MDVSGSPPDCDDCASPLQIAGTTAHPYWLCPQCRVARLAARGFVDRFATAGVAVSAAK